MKKGLVLTLCILMLLLPSLVVWAAMSGPLKVTCISGGKTATWTHAWTAGQSSYTLSAPVALTSGSTILGYLNSLSCGMNADPFLTLNFAVQAVGNANFFFDTGEMAFPVIPIPEAFATAAATITADGNGGTFTGLFAGGKAYEATYNGGTVFADLDGTFGTLANTSTTETERLPGGTGFTSIPVPVSSMRAQWSFNLTDGDGASGTSRYEIQPVPDASTIVLAAFGAVPVLAGLRRRKLV